MTYYMHVKTWDHDPPIGYQQCRGKMDGLDLLAHIQRRWRSATLDSLWLDMERLSEGVTDNEWQYIDDYLIIAFYKAPPKWISMMRRIAVAAEYVTTATQGDVLMEEEISNEEEDTEEESDSEDSNLD